MVRDPSSQLCANLFLGHRGPVFHCLSVNHMDRIGDAAEGVGVRGDIVGDDPVTAFPRAFVPAFSTTAPVSAAKPTTKAGRLSPAWLRLARMSGFSTRSKRGGLPFFLIFSLTASAARQSATAAAQTAISAGIASAQAVIMSKAVPTFLTVTPGGSASTVGPEIKIVSAPSAARAAAMA